MWISDGSKPMRRSEEMVRESKVLKSEGAFMQGQDAKMCTSSLGYETSRHPMNSMSNFIVVWKNAGHMPAEAYRYGGGYFPGHCKGFGRFSLVRVGFGWLIVAWECGYTTKVVDWLLVMFAPFDWVVKLLTSGSSFLLGFFGWWSNNVEHLYKCSKPLDSLDLQLV